MFCPNCSIGIDYIQTKERRCNNCGHEWENIHVLPVNDSIPHTETGIYCDCEPNLITESGNCIVVHNSYDGREGVEWANEILNK